MADPTQTSAKEAARRATPRAKTNDITEESYKGPSALVAAAGEGSIAHFTLGALFLALGFGVAYLYHGSLDKFIVARRATAQKLMGSTNGWERNWGETLAWLFGHGEGSFKGVVNATSEHHSAEVVKLATEQVEKLERGWLYTSSETIRKLPGIRHLLSFFGETAESIKRVDTAIMGGGLGLFFGFFIAPTAFWYTGARNAHRGKMQFENAKQEILETRAQYEALREKYLQARLELEDMRTLSDTDAGKVSIAKDEPPPLDQPETEHSQASAAKPSTRVHAAALESTRATPQPLTIAAAT